MRAVRITAPGALELVDVPFPSLDGSPGGEIVFQPRMACLCGSDVPFFIGDEGPYPLRAGLSLHEMVGEVVASSGTRFAPGDRVLGLPVGQRGAMEQFVLAEERATPWDDRLPAEIAVIAQPLGTVLYALTKLPAVAGLDVTVVGMGPMGHLHCAVMRNAGAAQIIAVDKLASRLQRAAAMGATATVCSTDVDPVERIAHLTDGKMPDLVIEAVGHREQALHTCIDLCRPHGRILYFGVPPARVDGVRLEDLFRKNITLHTSVNGAFHGFFPLAMRMIADGRIDVAPLVTHAFPFARIQDAFECFRERRDGALKVMIEF